MTPFDRTHTTVLRVRTQYIQGRYIQYQVQYEYGNGNCKDTEVQYGTGRYAAEVRTVQARVGTLYTVYTNSTRTYRELPLDCCLLGGAAATLLVVDSRAG